MVGRVCGREVVQKWAEGVYNKIYFGDLHTDLVSIIRHTTFDVYVDINFLKEYVNQLYVRGQDLLPLRFPLVDKSNNRKSNTCSIATYPAAYCQLLNYATHK